MIEDQSHRRLRNRIANGIVRYRWLLAVVGTVIGIAAYPMAGRLRMDRSISAMFAPDDPTLIAYQELQQAFGGNAVVMLVYEDPELWSAEGIDRNEVISEQVQEVVGVTGVLSPAVLNRAVQKIRPGALFSNAPALLRRRDNVSRGFDQLFAGYTHSSAHTRAAVVGILAPDHSSDTIESLKQIVHQLAATDAKFPITDVSLVGEPILIHDGFTLIENDGARLAVLTVTLLSIVVIISLFDLRFVILTSIVIAWSIAVTKASLLVLGVPLSLVSTMLTAIVTVITVTAVLHLGVRFQTARQRGHSASVAATRSLATLIMPIFWTCATDAAGFAALRVSRILPVQQFGIMIAFASAAVFIAVLLFGPAMMTLPGGSGRLTIARLQRTITCWLRRRCLRLAYWSVHHRGTCITASVVCTGLVVAGIGRAKTETSFLNNFRPSSEIVRAYHSVETNFGGAGVWDIVLDAPQELTEEFLGHVRELESELRQIDVEGTRLTKVISLADADAVAQRIRLLRLVSPSTRLSGMKTTMPVFFTALFSDPDAASSIEGDASPPVENSKIRIMLRSQEHLDSDRKLALISEVERVVRQHSPPGQTAPGRVTGYYVMMARLVAQLIGDQWRCFAASGLLVWWLLIAASRSLRLATAALVPNLLPVFLVLAVVGFIGGKINMGAAMIAAVSIGLSIDGSVHFLAAYRKHKDRGHNSSSSAIHAAGNIGVPVLMATIALVVGFGALVTSEFVPTATFGMLVAATLLLGTTVNLTILPSIVSWVDTADATSVPRITPIDYGQCQANGRSQVSA